jgi:hypothetical protein
MFSYKKKGFNSKFPTVTTRLKTKNPAEDFYGRVLH